MARGEPENAQSPDGALDARAVVAAEQLTAVEPGGRPGFFRRAPTKAKVGGAILLLFIFVAIFGPTLAPWNPHTLNAMQSVPLGPNIHHLLGTAEDGGDIFSQLMFSMRGTVVLGVATATIAATLSVGIGVTAGFLGGTPDEALSLIMNIFIVLPALPLLIIVLRFLPNSGQLPTAVVLSALGWSWGARVIRAQTSRCVAAISSRRRARRANARGASSFSRSCPRRSA